MSRLDAWFAVCRVSLANGPQRFLMLLVRGYQLLLSPWLGSSCRFEPTCSAYSLQALQAHGATAGTYLTLRRIGRCHPWCAGGHDPVPAQYTPWWHRLAARSLKVSGKLPALSSFTSRKKTLP